MSYLHIDDKDILLESRSAKWRELKVDINQMFPVASMLTADEKLFLYWIAKDIYKGAGEIIDAGAFVGSSSCALAQGLCDNQAVSRIKERITSYDLFEYNTHYRGFMEGVNYPNHIDLEAKKDGDTMEDIYRYHIDAFRENIIVVPGDICEKKWGGEPIEIFFVDVAKIWKINTHLLKVFFSSLIPGTSWVIQQDYFHHHTYWIPITMRILKDYFRVEASPFIGTLAFKLVKRIPKELLERDLESTLTVVEMTKLMDEAINQCRGSYQQLLKMAKIKLLIDTQQVEMAARLANDVRRHPHASINRFEYYPATYHIPKELLHPHKWIRKHMIGITKTYDVIQLNDTVYAVPHEHAQTSMSTEDILRSAERIGLYRAEIGANLLGEEYIQF